MWRAVSFILVTSVPTSGQKISYLASPLVLSPECQRISENFLLDNPGHIKLYILRSKIFLFSQSPNQTFPTTENNTNTNPATQPHCSHPLTQEVRYHWVLSFLPSFFLEFIHFSHFPTTVCSQPQSVLPKSFYGFQLDSLASSFNPRTTHVKVS